MKILLIGGSRGLGHAIKQQLKDHEVKELNRRHGGLDLEWPYKRIESTVRGALKELGGCDALIVSSGLSLQTSPVATEDVAYRMMKINHLSITTVYRAALRALLRSRGKAIFVSSTVVRKPSAQWLPHYAASKGALEGWFVAESKRAATHNVGMCIVRPGWFSDGMADNLACDTKAKAVRGIPMGRFGEPDEIAEFVVSLLDRTNWTIAGSIYEVTGGA